MGKYWYIIVLTIIIMSSFMIACAPSYYVVGNVTHRNESGELMNTYPESVIATQNYDYNLYSYIESKFFTGNGLFFNDRSGERRFIAGGIIQIDSVYVIKIEDYYNKSHTIKDSRGNILPSKNNLLISEYNKNERIIKDLSKMKREAENSKSGNEQYIEDVKEKLRLLKNRQATIERILYREYDFYIRTAI